MTTRLPPSASEWRRLTWIVVIVTPLWLTGYASRAHDFYNSWKDRLGYSCCNEHDCRPTVAWTDDQGRTWVMANGRPVLVPAEAILKIPSPDGRSHVCMVPGALYPRCVVIGEIRS